MPLTVKEVMALSGLSQGQISKQLSSKNGTPPKLKSSPIVNEKGRLTRIIEQEDYDAWQAQRVPSGPRPKVDMKRLIALDNAGIYSQTEIAAQLGVSQPTVCQALKHLGEKLKP